MPRPRNVQLLRDDAQLLAVDRRPDAAVRTPAARDAEGGQPASEDQQMSSVHEGCYDGRARRRAVSLRRPRCKPQRTAGGLRRHGAAHGRRRRFIRN